VAVSRTSDRQGHAASWLWFTAWVPVGVLVALSLVSLGLVLLVPVLLLVIGLMAAGRTIRRSAFGLATGAGILFLYLAYLDRDGPGTTCWSTATASGCDQHLDPRPWLAAGSVLVVVGVLEQVRRTYLAPPGA
jgi:hypothetical protein